MVPHPIQSEEGIITGMAEGPEVLGRGDTSILEPQRSTLPTCLSDGIHSDSGMTQASPVTSNLL